MSYKILFFKNRAPAAPVALQTPQMDKNYHYPSIEEARFVAKRSSYAANLRYFHIEASNGIHLER